MSLWDCRCGYCWLAHTHRHYRGTTTYCCCVEKYYHSRHVRPTAVELFSGCCNGYVRTHTLVSSFPSPVENGEHEKCTPILLPFSASCGFWACWRAKWRLVGTTININTAYTSIIYSCVDQGLSAYTYSINSSSKCHLLWKDKGF